MKITVHINVRNAQFYEAFEAYKKSHGKITMSHKQWAVKKDNPIKMYSSSVDFECTFNVNKFSTNRKGTYELPVTYHNNANGLDIKQNFHLDNVTVIEFSGESVKCSIVVSNELIDNYFDDKRDIGISECLYFNLNEKAAHNRITENIWLSDEKINELKRLFPNYTIDKDLNIKLLHEEGFVLPE